MDSTASTPLPGVPFASSPVPPPCIPDHELLRQVGRGAYGEVWLARSITGAFRAVKIVRRSSFEYDRPFEREFEGIQKFEPLSRRHDSQLDILHVGRGSDYFYYVMELADDQATGGQINPDNYQPRTLKSDLLFHSRLPFETCISVAVALTTALEHLHQNGLVHRDVKPSNIVFVNGVPKLADIGLVTGVDATRSYVGTEGFAAPEGPGTAQADLFSLGKVLYEAATGKDRQEFPELPTNLCELPDRDGLVELNAVIAKACRHAPEDRYASVAAMRADLELLQSGKSLARLRRAEQRLAFALRVGALALVLTLLAVGAWLYQTGQTKKVRQLVSEKEELLNENRSRLSAQYTAAGTHLLDTDDPAGALLFFAHALPLLTNNPDAEASHRIRIQQTLNQIPILEALFAHESAPSAAAFTPNGQTLAVCTDDGLLHLWDVSSGKPLVEPQQVGVQQTMLFNSNGSRLLMTPLVRTLVRYHRSRKDATVLDVVNRRVLHRSDPDLQGVAFSEDGEWLVTVASNSVVQVTDTHSGKALAKWSSEVHPIYNLSVSSIGGVVLANGTNDSIYMWKALTGESLRFPQQTGSMGYVVRNLAVTGVQQDTNYTYQSWDISSGEPLGAPMRVVTKGNVYVQLHGPDQSQLLVTLEPEGTSHVYELASGSLLNSFAPPGKVKPISGDSSRLVAFGGGQHIRALWDTAQERRIRGSYFLGGTVRGVSSQFAPKDTVLVATEEGTAELWRFVTPTEDSRESFPAEIANAQPEAFMERRSGDGTRALVTLKGHKAALLNLEDLKFQLLDFNGLKPYRAALDRRGEQAAIAYDPLIPGEPHKVVLWRGDRVQHELSVPPLIEPLQFSADGSTVFIRNTEAQVRLWSTEDGKCTLATLGDVMGTIEPADVGPVLGDDRTCFFTRRNGFVLVDLPTGRITLTFIPAQTVTHVASRLGLPWFLTTGHVDEIGTAQLWNSATGEAVTPPLRHGSHLTYGEISPTGDRFVVSGRSPEIRVLNARFGELALPVLVFGTRPVYTAAWSPDGKYIVARNDGRIARAWDAATGQPITPVLEHDGHIIAAVITPSNRLVTISLPNQIRSWRLTGTPLPSEVLLDYAMLVSGRRLNSEGIPISISPKQRETLFHSLRARTPELFDLPKRPPKAEPAAPKTPGAA